MKIGSKNFSKRSLLLVMPLFILLTGMLLYVVPVTIVGDKYLSLMAERKYASEFKDIDKILERMPPARSFDEPFCTELSLHELDENEHGWINSCSVTKGRTVKTDERYITDVLTELATYLAQHDWHVWNVANEDTLAAIIKSKTGSTVYQKKEPNSRSCSMQFYYDTIDKGMLSIDQSCTYYYRGL
jgi:hypothetical protein